ncbi:uncharacterized protein LOC131240136 [Magnolia sinica]|uniref:uncharacterized protein LOC131240136 n=1 Tax=Magnolia sinica TaxID=86752 RepID=UPI002659C8BF|nr:uncharacterized protein LOC131240136 [Magnolia sinica]
MGDFAAPSFSLGIDFDPDESLHQPSTETPINVSSQSVKDDSEDDRDFHPETLDPDLPPVLKRLKRGSPVPSSAISEKQSPHELSNADDDIEEFSSQEDRQKEEHLSIQNRSACSSSKFSLQSQRVLTTQSAIKSNTQEKKQASNASTSASLEESGNKFAFPKLTISPLRKFQLLDSDTDEPSSCENQPKNIKRADAYTKERPCGPTQSITGNQQKRAKTSSSMLQTESLWKDFSPKKNKLETPALDEFCQEYFRSLKDNNVSDGKEGDMRANRSKALAEDSLLNETMGCFLKNNIRENVKECGSQPNHLPPAYRYFCHNDPRVQKLVRHRLPNFFPIVTSGHRGQQQYEPAVIDYMSQFGHTDVSRKVSAQAYGTGNKGLGGSSKKSKKNLKNASAPGVSQDSGSWLNPRSCDNIPRDAGKRRVHADAHAAGHWYTGQDGRKVYVNKNGQELTGQMAYRQYRKESGAGFRKSKKKAAEKKSSKR